MSAYYACFDRNLTAIGCPSLSLPVPLRELEPDKNADLSPCVPPCPPVSLKENDYESEGRRFESCRALLFTLQMGVFLLAWFSPLRDSDWVLTYCISMAGALHVVSPTAPSVRQRGDLPRS